MVIDWTEFSKPCVKKLSHLVYLEDILLCYLLSNIVVVFVLLKKGFLSFIEDLEKCSLKPGFESKLGEFSCWDWSCVSGVIEITEHVVLDDLSGSNFMNRGVVGECRLVHEVMCEEIVLIIDILSDSAFKSVNILVIIWEIVWFMSVIFVETVVACRAGSHDFKLFVFYYK